MESLPDFEAFFKENENMVYKIIRGYIKQRDTAKDIVLETMMVIYNHWERVSLMRNNKGYLVRVAINAAKKHLIKGKLKKFFSIDQIDERFLISPDNPLDKTLSNEENKWIEAVLSGLKENERNIIMLKDIERKKFDDIAILLNMKQPTVKSLYRMAKLKMSAKMEVQYGEK